ncbi:hypothetical protein CEUSTIGMA_g9913.t1 [Chlamydomonas eustigma]|uniref:4Fe-4S Mo/W bis-MGD-type domain-containing protein n=1 Tax=Chlamydomonas eustigma TaxID=1157962 RepID=A0A250XHJ4_9CHLO|nr:hypothetical protein CEUSTIGMA_g9913.t1 [Chlamydomonas eustigma]|eukprot:GAX82486.1 hypothetical protein CEUSTIGMA_g9913.t1 [Chlamydomonas eustigma]
MLCFDQTLGHVSATASVLNQLAAPAVPNYLLIPRQGAQGAISPLPRFLALAFMPDVKAVLIFLILIIRSTDSVDVRHALVQKLKLTPGVQIHILPCLKEKVNEEWILDEGHYQYNVLKRLNIPSVKINDWLIMLLHAFIKSPQNGPQWATRALSLGLRP